MYDMYAQATMNVHTMKGFLNKCFEEEFSQFLDSPERAVMVKYGDVKSRIENILLNPPFKIGKDIVVSVRHD